MLHAALVFPFSGKILIAIYVKDCDICNIYVKDCDICNIYVKDCDICNIFLFIPFFHL